MPFVANEIPSVKLGSALLEVSSIAPHPDGSLVAASCDGVLHLFAWPTLKKVAKLKDEGGDVRYSPDGSILAIAGETSLKLHDPRKGTLARQLLNSEYSLNQLAFSPDGQRIAVGEAKRVLVFDVASGKQMLEFPVFNRTVKHVAWSPDGRYIATRSWEDAGVFDAATGAKVAQLTDLISEHGNIVFAADGALLTALDGNTVGVFAGDSWGAPTKRIATRSMARSIAVCGDLVALESAGSIQLVDRDFEPSESVAVSGEIFSLAFSSDGSALFAGVGATLFAFTRSGAAKSPKVEPPTVSVKLAGARTADRDVDFAKVPWLSRLGEPLPAGVDAKRVESLEAWPGPDAEGVAAFVELLETLETELEDAAKLKNITPPAGTYEAVFAAAAKRVPYDATADWSAPATAAPYTVATLAKIVERYRLLGWELPKPIETMWAWCLDGRWPAGFARKPGKAAVQLLVH